MAPKKSLPPHPKCAKGQSRMTASSKTAFMVTALLMKAFFTHGNLSLEELMHLRMNHPAIPKLMKLNGRVKGLPRDLSKECFPVTHAKMQQHNEMISQQLRKRGRTDQIYGCGICLIWEKTILHWTVTDTAQ